MTVVEMAEMVVRAEEVVVMVMVVKEEGNRALGETMVVRVV